MNAERMRDDEPDWADDRALEILRRLRWSDWLTSLEYLAAELRLIREQGVGEGIDKLGAELIKGVSQ